MSEKPLSARIQMAIATGVSVEALREWAADAVALQFSLAAATERAERAETREAMAGGRVCAAELGRARATEREWTVHALYEKWYARGLNAEEQRDRAIAERDAARKDANHVPGAGKMGAGGTTPDHVHPMDWRAQRAAPAGGACLGHHTPGTATQRLHTLLSDALSAIDPEAWPDVAADIEAELAPCDANTAARADHAGMMLALREHYGSDDFPQGPTSALRNITTEHAAVEAENARLRAALAGALCGTCGGAGGFTNPRLSMSIGTMPCAACAGTGKPAAQPGVYLSESEAATVRAFVGHHEGCEVWHGQDCNCGVSEARRLLGAGRPTGEGA